MVVGTTGKARSEEDAGSRRRRTSGGEDDIERREYSIAARVGGRPLCGY